MFNKIAPDKWKHFFAGILMGAVLEVVSALTFPGRPLLAALVALAVVIVISYGFELFSLITGKGHHDVMDAVASIIGGITGMLPGALVYQWMFA
ncbi:hypothetical protein SAMN05660461_6252 [Chitinophaga ginsengisegetis]|uniref:VanZ like family protein n=1 Tax=Chitinophaga ginsengisegetis TaxID=393003 RepID=A0A1T5PCK0_9BACT|nr:hypothetical protein [Chitinophaga ginsengisegetis]MDR6569177.1 hypothetical protein [Chitinophaga ginsengisegetis]MDR6648793.1 hypothetical protein [Chitinophaga ginsengisegetis]MDR6655259.1 hypothetical protein [Chitinophaga ginsengisegetis]SKD10343.1 hypothetical protein SAMN05660461_6252 [Chitinophaga ginsengisegetis]